jgi:phosphoribosylaminoimidazole-succinocarboxamide synthase
MRNYPEPILETRFNFPGQKSFYKGKVRDVYTLGNDTLVMIVTDRISAFDVVMPRGIPFKGMILNTIAAGFLEATKDIVPNWVIDVPHPMVTIGKKCESLKVEMVVRAYLAGHAWREYKSGKRMLCGVPMPEGMKENDRFPVPIITPTTKASEGHDEDISAEEIVERGLVSEKDYNEMCRHAIAVFQRGTQMARDRGLILVDTKYEFGIHKGEIHLIDEIHTPDSSRYFILESYDKLQEKGLPQKQLSKEFVREWLIANNFQGKEGQQIPEFTDSKIKEISDRYIELFEKITGTVFSDKAGLISTSAIEVSVNEWIKKRELV